VVSTAVFKKEEAAHWHLWHRLPLMVRSLLVSLAVAISGIQVWRYLVSANLAVSPRTPWAAAAMALYLFFYWHYLDGRGWPHSTAAARHRDLRARSLSPAMWRWSLLAGGSLMAATVPLTLLIQRFFPTSHAFPDFLQRLPAHSLLLFLAMSSLVAGVTEEAAFRGYLQAPIERRFGPVLAILITSAVFVLIHIPGRSGVSPAFLFLVALASLNYGILAHLTQSILPGLVLHVSGDAAAFGVLWWFQVTIGPREWHRVSLTEALGEPLFLVQFLELAVLVALSIWAFRKLAAQNHSACQRPDA